MGSEQSAGLTALLYSKLKDQENFSNKWEKEATRLKRVLEEEERTHKTYYANIKNEQGSMEAQLAEAQEELREKSILYDTEYKRFCREMDAATAATRECQAQMEAEKSQIYMCNEQLQTQLESQDKDRESIISQYNSQAETLQMEIQKQKKEIEELHANFNQMRVNDEEMKVHYAKAKQAVEEGVEEFIAQKQREMDDFCTQRIAQATTESARQIQDLTQQLIHVTSQNQQHIAYLQAREAQKRKDEAAMTQQIEDLKNEVTTLKQPRSQDVIMKD